LSSLLIQNIKAGDFIGNKHTYQYQTQKHPTLSLVAIKTYNTRAKYYIIN